MKINEKFLLIFLFIFFYGFVLYSSKKTFKYYNIESYEDYDENEKEDDESSTNNDDSFKSIKGKIIIYFRDNLYFCNKNKTEKVKITGFNGNFKKIIKNEKNKYIIFDKNKNYIWDVLKKRLKRIPGINSKINVSYYVNSKTSIGFKHGYYKTYLYKNSNIAGQGKIVWRYNRWKSLNFCFKNTGEHFFIDNPGMGKNESPYFIDLIIGSNQYLYYSKFLNSWPKKMLTKKGFLKPAFINNNIVYWTPGIVNKEEDRREIILENYSIKLNRVKVLNKVITTTKMRTTPDYIMLPVFNSVIYSSKSRGYNKSKWDTDNLILQNIITGKKRLLNNNIKGQIILPIKKRNMNYIFSNYLVSARKDGGYIIFSVFNVKNMKKVYQTKFNIQNRFIDYYFKRGKIRADFLTF